MNDNNINENNLFNLIKNKKFKQIYKLISSKKINDLHIKDNNNNYFIQYLINYNQYKILKIIFKLINIILIRLDILDLDGRTILYNAIKYNYIKIIKLLIKYNKKNIGISIINIQDKLGFTALHYSVIFNNYESFILLLENNADPYIISNNDNNIFHIILEYKQTKMLDYLLDKYHLNFYNSHGESLLQLAVDYGDNLIINKIFNKTININNKNRYNGLTVLHQSIISRNINLFNLLLNKKCNINDVDFYGNSALHFIIIYKYYDLLNIIINEKNLLYNLVNLDGNTPLHILLDDNIDNINYNIINKIIENTDVNLQNNNGTTCLLKIINNNLLTKFSNILKKKLLNIFIEDNSNNKIIITDELLNIVSESYCFQLSINKNLYNSFKNIYNIDIDFTECNNIIKNIILKENRLLINYINNIKLDNGIPISNCFYIGNSLDILMGLLLLYNKFKDKGLNLILDYPITSNEDLEKYYLKLGIDYSFKSNFCNIEITWVYQKIFFPTYFDMEIKKKMLYAKYIIIPIGIQMSSGRHANILLWDIKNKIIERFEPNGANNPAGFYYNPKLLDILLKDKFKKFDNNINYISPYNFLPNIGFQALEFIEYTKCKLGDPNGFCAVWCIWWIYQRMLNIDNKDLNIYIIAYEIIKYIKLDNKSFKTIIRTFSGKIVELRDKFLSKYNIDIDDWINQNFDDNIIFKLEKDFFQIFN